MFFNGIPFHGESACKKYHDCYYKNNILQVQVQNMLVLFEIVISIPFVLEVDCLPNSCNEFEVAENLIKTYEKLQAYKGFNGTSAISNFH